MSLKTRVVNGLLRLYPARWREEYGPELSEILLTRPLNARTIFDVAFSGVRERVRNPQPATIIGLAGTLLVTNAIITNITDPASAGALLADSTKTLPTIVVSPMESDWYALFLILWGCWTALRTNGTASASGRTGARISFIASTPIFVAGALMMFGVLPATTHDVHHAASHGFAFNYVGLRYTAWGVAVAPIFELPKCWMYGTVGGLLGRRISRVWRMR
jgi:hypothetical protein